MIQKYVLDSSPSHIGYLSTYPPKECGIANFTQDLIDATSELSELRSSVIAINEKGAIYDYDRRVKLRINRDKIEDYVNAAEYVNSSNIQLLVIQHEFGLYGGDYGANIKVFLENVKKPVITTLHTVQANFDQKAIETLRYIVERSESIVVIANAAINMLKNQGISCKKCAVIPHGCPSIEHKNNKSIKESLGLKGRLVASTFGLISSGKGIEYAIQALPEVIKKEPQIIYLIIGETHPEVKKNEGERYRNRLIKLVTELNLEKHVRFINKFVTKNELKNFLQATDIYLTPYISPNQISSGTLIYALGAGAAVVSTPYYHAQEVLANDRGILCKFEDSASIADGINKLLDQNFRNEIQKRAYKYSRRFLWKNVAKKYVNLIKSITEIKEVVEVDNITNKTRFCQNTDGRRRNTPAFEIFNT
jgi:glycosyltransferase involved in cell wall biosynthesis